MSYYHYDLCGKCQRSFDPDEGKWDEDGDFVCPKCYKDNQPAEDEEEGFSSDIEDDEDL